MTISFLGRETCHPTNPKCPECLNQKMTSAAASRIQSSTAKSNGGTVSKVSFA